jgi:addiction module HigA family antidote
MAKKLKPMHPGEVLREEFLIPFRMSAGALAKACGLPRTRIKRIASEQTGITADTRRIRSPMKSRKRAEFLKIIHLLPTETNYYLDKTLRKM